MLIAFNDFKGVAPRISPSKLPPGLAQIAMNVRVLSGDLETMNDKQAFVPNQPLKAGTVRTVFRYGEDQPEDRHWLNWTTLVDVVRSPIVDDTSERLFFSGTDAPRFTDLTLATTGTDRPGASYWLGVPQPETAPALTPGSGGSGTAETISYAYSYVAVRNGIREEGPLSLPTEITRLPGQTVNVGMATGPSSGSWAPITYKRIYRTAVGTAGAEWMLVAEIALASGSVASPYADSIASSALITVNQAAFYFPPPATLHSLTAMGAGMLAGIDGHNFRLCEQNAPHAWPDTYVQAIDPNPIGLGAFGSSIVCVTDADPYIGYGSSPAAIKLERISGGPACLSKASIVSMNNRVFYSSTQGIAVVGMDGWDIATKARLSAREWAWFKPESIIGVQMDSAYVAFFDNGTDRGSLIFDTLSGEITLCEVWADAAYRDPARRLIYIVQGNTLYKFDAGAPLSATWRSPVLTVLTPQNPSWLLVDAESYPVTVRLYADKVLRATHSVASRAEVPLQGGGEYLANDFEVEEVGSSRVRRIFVASTIEELQGAA